MPYVVLPAGDRPEWLSCRVSHHNHNLNYLFTVVQESTGQLLHMWQCPAGRHRYSQVMETRAVIRHDMPRWGWKVVPLTDGRICDTRGVVRRTDKVYGIPDSELSASDAYAKPTKFQGTSLEDMGF